MSEAKNLETMNEATQYLFEIKKDMKENHYIELMDILKKLYFKSDFKYEYYVECHITTNVCWIDNCGSFDKVKEELFYDEETYKNSAEEYNSDYEKLHEITTDSCIEIISNKEYNGEDLNEFVKNAIQKTPIIPAEIMETHQREVQKYYEQYIRYYDNWVRIVNNENFIIFVDIDYMGEHYA
jgi:Holliday junction resolvase